MNEFEGVVCAVLNHLSMKAERAYEAKEIHEFWNEWPAKPRPVELTLRALEQLEEEGMVERTRTADIELWRRYKDY